jgi:hypothetical protein
MMAAATRHVLMTTDAVGGVWTYALDLAEGFAEHGVRVTLAVLGPAPDAAQRAQAAAIPGLALVETDLDLDWTAPTPAALAAAADGLRTLVRGSDADLVHLNSPALAAGQVFDRPVVSVAHSCLATWWAGVRQSEMPEDFRWRTQRHWQGLLASDAVIAPSAAFADDTARTYEIPPPICRPQWSPQPCPVRLAKAASGLHGWPALGRRQEHRGARRRSIADRCAAARSRPVAGTQRRAAPARTCRGAGIDVGPGCAAHLRPGAHLRLLGAL